VKKRKNDKHQSKPKKQVVQNKNQKKNGWLTSMIIIGFGALIFGYFLSPFSPLSASGIPKLLVDKEKINFGDVKLNEEKTFSIKVTNDGDSDLKFTEKPKIKVVEGC
jgi:hypothetical protein